MEQAPDESLLRYREHLLASLADLPARQRAERPRRLQVFVNQDCIGELDSGQPDASLAFSSRERTIHLVELRSETGLLVGGFSIPELALRNHDFAWAGRIVTVSVHNRVDGGSVRVVAPAVPSVWERFVRSFGWWVPSPATTARGLRPGMQEVAFAQLGVVLIAGLVVADHLWDKAHPSTEQAPSVAVATAVGHEIVSSAQTRESLQRLEAQVQTLLAAQTASAQAVAGQQKTIHSVQRAVDELAQHQKQLGTQMVSVQQMEEQQERIAQRANVDVERMAKVLMGQVQSERVQLRDELHSLSMANEHLARHVSSMEKKNQELAGRLRTGGFDVSARPKSKDAGEPSSMVAQETTPKSGADVSSQSAMVADARTDASPFTFFVSFQDGTTEESIDRWFQELHARKGDADSGWYSVEVPRPAQQPADRFMEGLKDVKIVKAVATSRTRLPTR
ncbi:MAG: hypothetical protein U0172_07255 [Nitrospiraceae bacterium]